MGIRGSTFVNQEFLAADHGAAFGAALADGILSGSGSVTVSGQIVNIPAGLYIIDGRVFEISEAYPVSVSALSGYARIKVQLNMGGTATETSFNQISFLTETATTIAGFPDLVQNDINGNGLIYEAEIAVISCGASHTLVRQMMGASTRKTVVEVSVPAASWSNNLAQISVPGLPYETSPIVTFHPDYYTVWTESGVRAKTSGYQSMTLECSDTPTALLKTLIMF